jgi:YgiT-type zinc finger domain-containing protein
MKCYFCGGETEAALVTDLYAEGSLYLAVEDVPAEVCSQCGERYYGRDVTGELLLITQRAKQHAALALPGQRAEVTICQWQARRGDGTGTANDFWGTLVSPLVGETCPTLKHGHKFQVLKKGSNHIELMICSTGKPRRIARHEVEEAWQHLIGTGSLTRKEIMQQFSSRNPAYVAALLARMPGVEVRLDPVITLLYREEK